MSTAAGVLFMDSNDRVLLVQPSYKQHWDLPGGIVELGETPREAAVREVKEELGIDCHLSRMVVVDTVLRTSGSLLTAFVFRAVGRVDEASITVDGKEILGWDWCDPSAVEALTRTAPIFQSRLFAAVRASIGGRTEYLESRSIA